MAYRMAPIDSSTCGGKITLKDGDVKKIGTSHLNSGEYCLYEI